MVQERQRVWAFDERWLHLEKPASLVKDATALASQARFVDEGKLDVETLRHDHVCDAQPSALSAVE